MRSRYGCILARFSFCVFILRDEVFFIVPSVEARYNGIFFWVPPSNTLALCQNDELL